MKKLLIFLFFFGFSSLNISAQRALNGIWVGTLSQGGETYEIKLELKKDGRKLSGNSLVVLSDTSYIQLHVNGIYHADRSMNIYEITIVHPTSPDVEAGYFKRTYQLLYNRKFNDHFLEGWWQEKEKSATDENRRYGKIQLQRIEDKSKA